MSAEYNTGHKVLSIPFTQKDIRMERSELEKLCNEMQLPLFHIRIHEYAEMGIVQSCEPYTKYFTLYGGQVFVATERTGRNSNEKGNIKCCNCGTIFYAEGPCPECGRNGPFKQLTEVKP